jgi:hypothetical protein
MKTHSSNSSIWSLLDRVGAKLRGLTPKGIKAKRIAHEKRALERSLRASGLSRSQATREVSIRFGGSK